jgi:hypothetical protein
MKQKRYFHEDKECRTFSIERETPVEETINGVDYFLTLNNRLVPIELIKNNISEIWEVIEQLPTNKNVKL